eukprot:g3929.t1
MAEFSDFLGDSFDLKGWINSALDAHQADGSSSNTSSATASSSSSSSSSSSIDAHISSLVHKLQYLSHDVNETLDDCMGKMMAAAPRAAVELARVSGEAAALKGRVEGLAERAGHLSREGGGAVETLRKLDTVKRNIEGCQETLQEAAGWNRLTAAAEAHLAAGEGGLGDMAGAIAAL